MSNSSYRMVKVFEICRLCTSFDSPKINIFDDDGKRREIAYKIGVCFPFLRIREDDLYPKVLCTICSDKLEQYYAFRESCIKSEQLLSSFLMVSQHAKCYVKCKEANPATVPLYANKPIVNVDNLGGNSVNTGDLLGNLLNTIGIIAPAANQTDIVSSSTTEEYPPSTSAAVIGAHFEQTFINKETLTGAQVTTNTCNQVTLALGNTSYSAYESNSENISTAEKLVTDVNYILGGGTVKLLHVYESMQATENDLPSIPTKTSQAVEVVTHKYRCEICNKEFLKGTYLKRHKKRHETVNKTFNCKMCELVFQKKQDLIQHSTQHELMSNFFCKRCCVGFDEIEDLFQHNATSHFVKKDFACKFCDKKYCAKKNLQKHEEKHHKDVGGQFYCSICKKLFSIKSKFLMHCSIHSGLLPYVCTKCEKGFPEEKYLLAHTCQINEPSHSNSQETNLPLVATQISAGLPDVLNI